VDLATGEVCGICGKIPEFRRGLLVSGRVAVRQWSIQVIVQGRILVEWLRDPAYVNPAMFVRDMRQSSVFKHGRFPDTQCWASQEAAW